MLGKSVFIHVSEVPLFAAFIACCPESKKASVYIVWRNNVGRVSGVPRFPSSENKANVRQIFSVNSIQIPSASAWDLTTANCPGCVI